MNSRLVSVPLVIDDDHELALVPGTSVFMESTPCSDGGWRLRLILRNNRLDRQAIAEFKQVLSWGYTTPESGLVIHLTAGDTDDIFFHFLHLGFRFESAASLGAFAGLLKALVSFPEQDLEDDGEDLHDAEL